MNRPSRRLVGREKEQQVVAGALDRLRGGIGEVVVVESPPGLGKTSLLAWLADECDRHEIASIRAAADTLMGGTPFMVARALLPSLQWDADEQPIPDTPAPGVATGVVFETVERAREALEHLALEPLVVVVDDLHWADHGSVAVLAAAAELATTLPLLLVVTTRPAAEPRHVEAIAGRCGRPVTWVELSPLDPDASARLAAAVSGAPPGPALRWLVDGVAGNPLLIVELLRALDADGELVRRGDVVDTERAELPPTLQAGVNRRLRQLGVEVVDATRAVAAAGPAGDVTTLAAVLGRPHDEVSRALEAAHGAGILDVDGDRFTFHHDLIREAVYLDMAAPTRSALHRRLADVLNRSGSDPAQVAVHLAVGAAPGDADAVAWLASAADEVQRAAPSAALTLVDKALELTRNDPAGQRALQRARLDLLIQLGRLDEATTLARVLMRVLTAELTAPELASLHGRAGGLLILQRQAEEGLRMIDQGIDLVDDPGARGRLVAQRAMAKMTVADHAGAGIDADEAIRLARSAEDAVGASIALSITGRIGSFTHEYRRGLEPGVEAVLIAERDDSGEAHLHLPCFYYALTGLDVDDLDLAERAIAQGRAAATRLGHVYALPLYCGAAASVHYRRGELDDAWAEASAGLSLARDTGSHQASMWCEAFRALVALLRGELDDARRHAAASEEEWAAHSTPLGVDFMAVAVAGAAEASGAAETAFEVLDGAWEAFGAIGVESCQPLLGADLVRTALAIGRTGRAADVAGALTHVAAVSGLEWHRALAAHTVALVEEDVALLREAVRRHDAVGRRLDATRCLADAARVAHHTDDPAVAELLAEATTRFGAMGASGAAERLEGELQGSTSSSARDRFGWGSLTPTEQAIVALVAGGLTNAEIASRRTVSRRTVESHLVRVYTKLGITSRVQLAVEAAERGFA